MLWARPLIRSKGDSKSGIVYEAPTGGNYTVSQFHEGFTSPAVQNKRMVVPAKGGGILAVFSNRKKSVTPAREIWPSGGVVLKQTRPLFNKWVKKGLRTKWR